MDRFNRIWLPFLASILVGVGGSILFVWAGIPYFGLLMAFLAGFLVCNRVDADVMDRIWNK